ncbi:DEAD/DEAH box helicase [Nocardioides cavernae]|uniref:DEAD/DEAH box helicase n=2 Tax=Nocardioides cavernae TaxID=1921566 RepID=A0ABR8NEG9_9ACTN|nr:DEAD/DEAH box helicase [Nocardioides cavernae]MBD3926529.1 DEAD/DEAH box helicase [Nocardioides cavernae]MBM7512248.1 superfamily II DNA or RNA helicase [Nocardioides cavernae]
MTGRPDAPLPPAWPDRAAWGTAPSLRAWQQAAMDHYQSRQPRDFLAVATPGAGKTTFALTVAADLLSRRIVDRITVVAPTEHLKTQWAEAAARAGIPIDPTYSAGKGRTSDDYVGIAVTYAGVAVNPLAMRIRTERFKTLVILDEIHHAGDALSWGEGVRESFDPATRRLALTGTPFRSDINPIPFVTYAPGDDGIPTSSADFTYGYAHALADHVVRPVLFMAYSGEMQWRTRAGDEVVARLGEPLTKDMHAQALRTALDPRGSWIPAVLEAADRRLSEVRRHVPDAAGLVIAGDQETARAYAALLKKISGETPTVVLSDEKGSSKKIEKFTHSEQRWMVAVRMVSEGVDVPRLAVGVWATTVSTPLFFAQAVGRFVRARSRGETASVFLPSVPHLLEFASDMEAQRDHVLGRRVNDEDDIFAAEEGLLAAANAEDAASGELEMSWEALGSTASFDHVLYEGAQFGHSGEVMAGSEEEMDFLGIPGLLEADQVRELLHSRQSERARKQKADGVGDRVVDSVQELSTHQQLGVLRRELNGLVAAWHHRTGQAHGITHNALRKECGGPPAAVANADQLHERINRIREWAVRKTS